MRLKLTVVPHKQSLTSAPFASKAAGNASLSVQGTLRLSVVATPCLMVISTGSLSMPTPTSIGTVSAPLGSSLYYGDLASVYLPQGICLLPTLHLRPGGAGSSGKGFLSSDAHEGSYPATPLAPAVTAFVFFFYFG